MFEFEDSKLGKLKIVNVTEARSSIATIMNDTESNYVITKNNKPIRVIINYPQFRKLQLNQSNSSQSRSSKSSESKVSLRGLIEDREKDLIKQGSRSMEGLLEPSRAKQNVPFEEPMVASKQQLIQPPPENVVFPDAPKEIPEAIEVQQELPNELPEELPDELPDQTQQQSASLKNDGSTNNMDQGEGDDYFTRFKTLYSQSPRFEENRREAREPREAMPSYKEDETVAPKQEPKPERLIPKEKVYQKSEPVQSEAFSPRGRRYSAASDPPSIQDLLKELENEKLSGEEGGQADSADAQGLLNKISHSGGS